jgi:hypothetical protein
VLSTDRKETTIMSQKITTILVFVLVAVLAPTVALAGGKGKRPATPQPTGIINVEAKVDAANARNNGQGRRRPATNNAQTANSGKGRTRRRKAKNRNQGGTQVATVTPPAQTVAPNAEIAALKALIESQTAAQAKASKEQKEANAKLAKKIAKMEAEKEAKKKGITTLTSDNFWSEKWGLTIALSIIIFFLLVNFIRDRISMNRMSTGVEAFKEEQVRERAFLKLILKWAHELKRSCEDSGMTISDIPVMPPLRDDDGIDIPNS